MYCFGEQYFDSYFTLFSRGFFLICYTIILSRNSYCNEKNKIMFSQIVGVFLDHLIFKYIFKYFLNLLRD